MRPEGILIAFLIFMISGAKAPDFDACGLFRATHSHNPIQYSHIVGLVPWHHLSFVRLLDMHASALDLCAVQRLQHLICLSPRHIYKCIFIIHVNTSHKTSGQS